MHALGSEAPVITYNGSSTEHTARHFLLKNHQGSVIAQTSQYGNLEQLNTYDEFGVPGVINTGRFGYTGQLYLKEIGLYHYKARVYYPQIGRFLQVDPVGYEDQINLYAYVGNDPINFTDPSGLCRSNNGNPKNDCPALKEQEQKTKDDKSDKQPSEVIKIVGQRLQDHDDDNSWVAQMLEDYKRNTRTPINRPQNLNHLSRFTGLPQPELSDQLGCEFKGKSVSASAAEAVDNAIGIKIGSIGSILNFVPGPTASRAGRVIAASSLVTAAHGAAGNLLLAPNSFDHCN